MSKAQKMLSFYLSAPSVQVHLVLLSGALWIAFTMGGWWTLTAIIGGWFSYLVQEHLVHRFIFHAPAPSNQFWFNALYRLHYGHHDQIHNVRLLFTPLWFSLGLGFANITVVALVLPLPYAIVFVYGGGVAAYLLFEWMHLLSHFRFGNGRPIALWVTRRHAQHHFIDYHSWFTVSPGGNLVDSALGAVPAERVKVPNVRTCGLDENDARLIASRARFGTDNTLATVGVEEWGNCN